MSHGDSHLYIVFYSFAQNAWKTLHHQLTQTLHLCAVSCCTASTKIETKWKHMQHNYNIIDERKKKKQLWYASVSRHHFLWEHQAYGAMINLIDSFTAKVQMHKFYFQWCYAALNNDAMRCKAAGVNETNWPMQQNWIICLKCCYFFGSSSLSFSLCVCAWSEGQHFCHAFFWSNNQDMKQWLCK